MSRRYRERSIYHDQTTLLHAVTLSRIHLLPTTGLLLVNKFFFDEGYKLFSHHNVFSFDDVLRLSAAQHGDDRLHSGPQPYHCQLRYART